MSSNNKNNHGRNNQSSDGNTLRGRGTTTVTRDINNGSGLRVSNKLQRNTFDKKGK